MESNEKELLEVIAKIAYLYKSERLNSTNFFDQYRSDLEHLLGVLKDYNYQDNPNDIFEVSSLISQLDSNGFLPVRKCNVTDFLKINQK